eukprot:12847484-Ditylum_brightwellii.AAC.1
MDALPGVQQDLVGQASFVSDDLQNLKHQLLGLGSALDSHVDKIEGIDFPHSLLALHHLVDVKAGMVDVWSQLTSIGEKLQEASSEMSHISNVIRDHTSKFQGLQKWIPFVCKHMEEIPALKQHLNIIEAVHLPSDTMLES